MDSNEEEKHAKIDEISIKVNKYTLVFISLAVIVFCFMFCNL